MSRLLDLLLNDGDEQRSRSSSDRTLRALSWARVSTDMQEERGLSLPEQQRQIREYAERHNIIILEEYHEAASAFRKPSKRVEFNRMLEHAQSDRQVDAILVHDYSRFSRDSLKARTLLRELRQAGVRVISLNDLEADPETVQGVYLEAITFAKNEAFSREVAFHTKKGCRANVQTRDPETGWCYKNGGQPLWGYRSERVTRGEVSKGRPIVKSFWVPDDTVVAGKPVHEWARYCLVELAAKGATLDALRDFCNDHGIRAPRQQYWGSTTWNSLLHPHCLLEYAGYGVWNVRGKSQRINPRSEWIIMENAHQALITEDEAQAILEARQARSFRTFAKTSNRAKSSRYLSSGGLFKCARCGGNMVGSQRVDGKTYYLCNSIQNRRGLGCGPGVYVSQQEVEREVAAGLRDILKQCTDRRGFAKDVNRELRAIWEESHGYDPQAAQRLEEVEAAISNIRLAIEKGLSDQWSIQRLNELHTERDQLETAMQITQEAPRLNVDAAVALRKKTEKILSNGNPADRKAVLRPWVRKIELAPENLEVEITYQIPEPVVDGQGAGGRSIMIRLRLNGEPQKLAIDPYTGWNTPAFLSPINEFARSHRLRGRLVWNRSWGDDWTFGWHTPRQIEGLQKLGVVIEEIGRACTARERE